ncbi:hypothetical protein [uncultured Friedmanniella sp.]|uniref:hypothetical protein n=1 Tax=uncultured Friedmanniella sp. TaxID=335381 RepID=UPI0035CC788D
MTDILIKSLDALWQVALVGLVLGAGLPALFALGVRSLNTGRLVTAGGSGAGAEDATSTASAAGKAGAAVCFAICILAVAFGIVVIVYGKQLFGV